jgi:hypothetical protein
VTGISRSHTRAAVLLGCGAVVAVALARLALFLGSPIDAQIPLIPDDAFYYFVPARNFARLGVWTFDGVAPATGFHLWYAYLLAGVFLVAPSVSNPALIAGLACAATALIGASAYLVTSAAARDFGPRGVLGVALAFTAPVALWQQTFLVECPWVLLFASGLLALLSRAAEVESLSAKWLAAAFLLGLFGNLARSDFGLFGASCAAAFFLHARESPAARRRAALAAVATLGSTAGVALLLLHTWHWSGSFAQSSARMKSHWGELLGYDIRGYLRFLRDLVAPYQASWLGTRALPGLVIALAVAGAVTRLGRDLLRIERWPLAVGCAVSVLGYVVFYGRVSAGVPPWYLANSLAALGYLLGGLLSFLPQRAFVPAVAIVALCAFFNLSHSLEPIWPNQVAMRAAAEYLRAHPEVEPVGAWNAGILSGVSGRAVTNLDGLVNDDVYPYAVTGRLLDYVCQRRLRFVLDFADNVENPQLAARAGYADGRLRAALTPEVNFSNGERSRQWAGTDLQLWSFDRHACPGYEE